MMDSIKERLFSLSDEGYKEFMCPLIPTVSPNRIIGVRVPLLRDFANEIKRTDAARAFMDKLPHSYHEENNLHAFLIEATACEDEAYRELCRFLPYIDNWATCDSLSVKLLSRDRGRLIRFVRECLESEHTYTVRFGICMLMKYFLCSHYSDEYTNWLCGIKSDDYYVNMAIAWYLATALAYNYDEAVAVLSEKRMSRWVHNKAIVKACDSKRLSEDKKVYLRTLKY